MPCQGSKKRHEKQGVSHRNYGCYMHAPVPELFAKPSDLVEQLDERPNA